MNLPNKLTLLRMGAIPLIIIISIIDVFKNTTLFLTVTLDELLIAIIFLLASFTDFLDGHIARKYNLVTNFGKFMDPLADKLLVLTALIFLLERGKMVVFGFSLGFVVTIILAREFMVTGIRLIAVTNNKIIAASKLGKIKTTTQMIMIFFLIVDCLPLALFGGNIKDITTLVLIIVAGTLTIVSGVDYFIKNKDLILNDK